MSIPFMMMLLLFGAVAFALALPVILLVLILRACGRRGEGQRLAAEEQATLDRLRAQLDHMEQRLSNLEVILNDRPGARRAAPADPRDEGLK